MPIKDVTIYHFDQVTKEHIGSEIADRDPIDGKVLLPACTTPIAPPTTIAAGKVAVFNEATSKWSQQEDNRGKVYDTSTGMESVHRELGALPAKLTSQAPTANSSWDAAAAAGKGAWVFDTVKAAADQIAVINAACAAAIVGGFSSTALGTVHTYDSALEDQVNLIGVAGAGVDLAYTCTDAAGVKAAVLHTAVQLGQVYSDGLVYKAAQLSKARALKNQLEALAASTTTTQADIDLVVW